MSRKDEKGKPIYEAPKMMRLSALARGQTGTCSTGSGALEGCNPTGNSAGNVCNASGNAAENVCSASGNSAVHNCGNGSSGPP
jgi:hypothetical protein